MEIVLLGFNLECIIVQVFITKLVSYCSSNFDVEAIRKATDCFTSDYKPNVDLNHFSFSKTNSLLNVGYNSDFLNSFNGFLSHERSMYK